jgi:hypothetical protein
MVGVAQRLRHSYSLRLAVTVLLAVTTGVVCSVPLSDNSTSVAESVQVAPPLQGGATGKLQMASEFTDSQRSQFGEKRKSRVMIMQS